MDSNAFIRELETAGYVDIKPRDYPANNSPPAHTHDFDVAGLVLSGEFGLACGDSLVLYRPGQRFELARGVTHAETAGPEGAKVIIAIKY
jgi:quercetin dioxygenase-like cupin family protein